MSKQRSKKTLLLQIVQGGITLCLFVYSAYIFWSIPYKTYLFELNTLFNSPITLGICLLLAPSLNWGLEALKWKSTLSPSYLVSLSDAWKTVRMGLVLSLFFPFQAGSWVGKSLAAYQIPTSVCISAHLVGSSLQACTTFFFGCFAWYFSDSTILSSYSISFESYYILIIVGVVLILSWLLLKIPSVKNRWLIEQTKLIHFKHQLGLKKILLIGLLSILRYLCFSFPFALILYSLSSNLSLFLLWKGVCLLYFYRAFIPQWGKLGGLGVREAAALWVFQPMGLSDASILLSSLLIFIFHALLPAFMGDMSVFWTKNVSNADNLT